jgi:hypothetical protein
VPSGEGWLGVHSDRGQRRAFARDVHHRRLQLTDRARGGHRWVVRYSAVLGFVLFACASTPTPFVPIHPDAASIQDASEELTIGFPDAFPDAPLDAGPTFRYVFLSSVTFPGDLGGAPGADALCQKLAAEADLPGTYKAWISTDQSSPHDTFEKSLVGYELPNGIPVAQGFTELTTNALLNPINVDEHGQIYDGGCSSFEPCGWTAVWTQTRTDGRWEEAGASASCFGFMSDDAGASGHVGSYVATDNTWTSGTGATPPLCSSALPIYCFEQ